MVLDLQRACTSFQKIQHCVTNDFIVDKDEGIIWTFEYDSRFELHSMQSGTLTCVLCHIECIIYIYVTMLKIVGRTTIRRIGIKGHLWIL